MISEMQKQLRTNQSLPLSTAHPISKINKSIGHYAKSFLFLLNMLLATTK